MKEALIRHIKNDKDFDKRYVNAEELEEAVTHKEWADKAREIHQADKDRTSATYGEVIRIDQQIFALTKRFAIDW
jgi:hypothetical protein